jgi:hypothetical protein
MKRISMITLALCFIANVDAQTELKHGILVGGGKGFLQGMEYNKNIPPNGEIYTETLGGNSKYKNNFSIGYKLRFQKIGNPSFFDMDIQFGAKTNHTYIDYECYYLRNDAKTFEFPSTYEGNHTFYNFSVAATYNYKIYKKLYTGLGVEPTMYHLDGGGDYRWKYDVPIIGKLGYDFKYFDVAVVYKYGLTNMMKTARIDAGKFNDWQIQLFIPF